MKHNIIKSELCKSTSSAPNVTLTTHNTSVSQGASEVWLYAKAIETKFPDSKTKSYYMQWRSQFGGGGGVGGACPPPSYVKNSKRVRASLQTVGTSLENRLVTSGWRCYYFIQIFKVFLI